MAKEIRRKCRGCFETKNRDDLIKITKLQNGTLKINPNSKEIGRSVYVCKNIDCIKQMIKKKGIKSALKYNNHEETEKIEKELMNIFKNNS